MTASYKGYFQIYLNLRHREGQKMWRHFAIAELGRLASRAAESKVAGGVLVLVSHLSSINEQNTFA